MKRKLVVCAGLLIFVLTAASVYIVFGNGWRPFKHLKYEDFDPYSVKNITLGENPTWWTLEMEEVYQLVELLNEVKVTPYFGDTELFDESTMCYVFRYSGEGAILNRIGVTLNPEPIMTIEGKEYRIEREIAERYKDLWEKSAK